MNRMVGVIRPGDVVLILLFKLIRRVKKGHKGVGIGSIYIQSKDATVRQGYVELIYSETHSSAF